MDRNKVLIGLGIAKRKANPLGLEGYEDGGVVNPYDKATQDIDDTTVFSRFTKTPIRIVNSNKMMDRLMQSAKALGVPMTVTGQPKAEPVSSGSYKPSTRSITVETGSNPTWSDLQNSMHHEDIHALLQDVKPESLEVPDASDWFGWNPSHGSYSAWANANRAGAMRDEMPAYMGAYNDKDVKVSPGVREEWLKRLRSNLPPGVADTYDRIMRGADASQDVSWARK